MAPLLKTFSSWNKHFLSSQHVVSNYTLTYLLTHSTVQSPSWAANWFAASQEIPHISRNPKVHYRTHKLPPPLPILGQPYTVHIPTSHLEIHPNIIHPSTPRSPQWSFPLYTIDSNKQVVIVTEFLSNYLLHNKYFSKKILHTFQLNFLD